MSEFDFDGWLDYLKFVGRYEGYEPDYESLEAELSDEVLEEQEFLYRIGNNFSLTIQIMESGIFREGKLKGRKISGKYRLYPIENIKELIIEVVKILNGLESLKEREQTVDQQFDSILNEYDKLSKIVLECKGIRPEKVKAIRDDLAVMKNRTLMKLIPISSLPPEIMPSLIAIFKKYVPTAPNQTIAARISELLKTAGFDVKQETIRKKLQTQIPTV
jgi:hypothetical protein